jgi:predicted NUDIX family phosphoesterase
MEQVLVFKSSQLQEFDTLQGCMPAAANIFDTIFEHWKPFFMLRNEAENNPKFKQLIPYVLIRRGGDYLRYQRGGTSGEKRLMARYSIGVGGHINPIDSTSTNHVRETYFKALKRELSEEVDLDIDSLPPVIGLINDDSDEVGQVHLGCVHLLDFCEPGLTKAGELCIKNVEFVSPPRLWAEKDKLESWSKLALEAFLREQVLLILPVKSIGETLYNQFP